MKPYSFSSKERILKDNEFQRLFKDGKKVITRYFVWFFLDDKVEGVPRKLGIVVNKGVGKANQRNRIKRQVREFFRLNKGSLPRGRFVVKARSCASLAENSVLKKDLKKGSLRLGVE